MRPVQEACDAGVMRSPRAAARGKGGGGKTRLITLTAVRSRPPGPRTGRARRGGVTLVAYSPIFGGFWVYDHRCTLWTRLLCPSLCCYG